MSKARDIADGTRYVDVTGDTMTGRLEIHNSTETGYASNTSESFTRSTISLRGHATDSPRVAIGSLAAGVNGAVAGSAYIQRTNGTSTWDLHLQPFGGRVLMPNQPAFRAQESPSSVGGGAPAGGTAIIYSNVVFNIGNRYNNTNGRFTAPVSGLYLFGSAGYWPNQGLRSLAFWKNGSRVNEHYEDQTGNCFCLIYCNAGDYVISSWGSPPSNYTGTGNYWSYEGYLIG